MNQCMLYLIVSIFSIAVAIFNFTAYNKASSIQCFTETTDETPIVPPADPATRRLVDFMVSKSTETADSLRDLQDKVPTVTQVKESESYSTMIILIALVYIIIFCLALFLSLLLACMSDLIPEDFADAGILKKSAGLLCKILPKLNLILHYVALLLILIVWILQLTKSCNFSKPILEDGTSPAKYDRYAYYGDITLVAIVDSIAWVILQYGVAIFRNMIYTEPFMYAPVKGNSSAVIKVVWSSVGP